MSERKTVFVVSYYNDPYGVFSTKERAALWIYEQRDKRGQDWQPNIYELEIDPKEQP